MSQTFSDLARQFCRTCGEPHGKPSKRARTCDDCQKAQNARHSREHYARRKAAESLGLSALWLRRPLVVA